MKILKWNGAQQRRTQSLNVQTYANSAAQILSMHSDCKGNTHNNMRSRQTPSMSNGSTRESKAIRHTRTFQQMLSTKDPSHNDLTGNTRCDIAAAVCRGISNTCLFTCKSKSLTLPAGFGTPANHSSCQRATAQQSASKHIQTIVI